MKKYLAANFSRGGRSAMKGQPSPLVYYGLNSKKGNALHFLWNRTFTVALTLEMC